MIFNHIIAIYMYDDLKYLFDIFFPLDPAAM